MLENKDKKENQANMNNLVELCGFKTKTEARLAMIAL